MKARAEGSRAARWDHFTDEWGLETWFAIVALGLVVNIVLDGTWLKVASTALGLSLLVPLGVKVIRSFRQGYQQGD